jgi:hypothetical protein
VDLLTIRSKPFNCAYPDDWGWIGRIKKFGAEKQFALRLRLTQSIKVSVRKLLSNKFEKGS